MHSAEKCRGPGVVVHSGDRCSRYSMSGFVLVCEHNSWSLVVVTLGGSQSLKLASRLCIIVKDHEVV